MAITYRIGVGGDRQELGDDLPGGTALDLLHQLGLTSQEVLVALNGEVVAVDTPLQDGDEITLIRAITGG